MTTWPLRRTQITVVERMRFLEADRPGPGCAALWLWFKTKTKPPEIVRVRWPDPF
jgi:hypothetical protein